MTEFLVITGLMGAFIYGSLDEKKEDYWEKIENHQTFINYDLPEKDLGYEVAKTPLYPSPKTIDIQNREEFISQVEWCKVNSSLKVHFEHDSVKISEANQALIADHLKMLEKCSVKHIAISGHASEVGLLSYNLKLAKNRAVEVQNFIADLNTEQQVTILNPLQNRQEIEEKFANLLPANQKQSVR